MNMLYIKGRRAERRATSSLDDYAEARMALGEAKGVSDKSES